LETPSFEKPEVWATEITALNGLSGANTDELDSVVDGVREVVKKAEGNAKKGAKPKKAPKKAIASKKGKKQEVSESDRDSD
jgi:hypothetical protein